MQAFTDIKKAFMYQQKAVSKKLIINISIIFLLCILFFCIAQVWDYSVIYPIKITAVDNKSIVKWNIDKISYSTHYIKISGWAFVFNEEPAGIDFNLVLENTRTKDSIVISTVFVDRPDLNTEFTDGTDYSHNGFYSRVNKKQLDLNNNSYEIYLMYFNNTHRVFVKTNQMLSITAED